MFASSSTGRSAESLDKVNNYNLIFADKERIKLKNKKSKMPDEMSSGILLFLF
jgi:hypothetical protein